MEILLTLFFFLIIVGFLVFVHEFGHFAAAKLSKIPVKEFAIGFGPSLLKKQIGETKYKLNLLPLGGFVQLEGETDENVTNGFRNKPFYIKAFVLSAGVLMNILTAIVLLFITLEKESYNIPIPNIASYSFHNVEAKESFYPVTILNIEENTEWSGLKEGDTIVKINENKFSSIKEFNNLIEKYRGKKTNVTLFNLETFETSKKAVGIGGLLKGKYFPIVLADVMDSGRSKDQLKDGEILVAINDTDIKSSEDFFNLLDKNQGKEVFFKFINPETLDIYSRKIKVFEKNDEGAILDVKVSYGIGLDLAYDPSNWETYFIKYKKNILSAPALAFDMSFYQLKGIGNLVSNAISSGNYEEVSKAVGGPVALGDSVNQVVEYRVYDAFFFLTALISLSLAIFNILPIPALDGGQIAIAFVETVRRKRLPDSVINKINLAGFIFIIILSIVITLKDIRQLNIIENLENLIKGIFGK